MLYGGIGDDITYGGFDDSYVVDTLGGQVIEHAGAGIDMIGSCVTYTLGTNLESFEIPGAANLDGTCNALRNVTRGNAGKNVLHGLGGYDSIEAEWATTTSTAARIASSSTRATSRRRPPAVRAST